MDKWEYMTIIVSDTISISDLNEYGKNGWELVYLFPYLKEDKREIEVIFKRKLCERN